MKISRFSFFALSAVLVAGCGGSDPDEAVSSAGGGDGNSGAAGGTSGAAGYQGNAAGTAGTNQGGSGGKAGGSGMAGTGGVAGGLGGGGNGGGGAEQGGHAGDQGGQSGGGIGGQAGSSGQGGAGHGGISGAAGGTAGGAAGGSGCQAGSFLCAGDELQTCGADGKWGKKDTCGKDLCDATQGKCRVCHPGEVKGCSEGTDTKQDVCNLEGAGFEPTDCEVDHPFCVEGACAECLTASDCPVPDNSCLTATCEQHACSTKSAPEGTVLSNNHQTPKDCKKVVCDGEGATKTLPDDLDLPSDSDVTDCSAPTCSMGSPGTAFVAVGTKCKLNGAPNKGFCLTDGTCEQCLPGTNTCFGDTLESCSNGSFVETKCDPATPVCSVDACASIVHLAAGRAHTCALLSNGRVTCWGDNTYGRLGVDVSRNADKSHEVMNLTDAVAIAAGGDNSCAIRGNGKVVCWGAGGSGQLGGGDSPVTSSSPVEVLGLDQAVALAVGSEFACAIAGPNKEVSCWGKNDHLQLGSAGGSKNSAAKIKTTGIAFKQLVAGTNHACALANNGDVYCWGSNDNEQLGVDIGSGNSLPTQVDGISKATSINAGSNHTCLFGNSGVTCWGANGAGQLGNGKTSFNSLPTATLFGVLTNGLVAGGGDSTCVLDAGQVKCVGSNTFDQLGGGTKYAADPAESTPIDVTDSAGLGASPMTMVVEVAMGKEHACALKASGDVVCWGNNVKGRLGLKDDATPIAYAELVSWSLP